MQPFNLASLQNCLRSTSILPVETSSREFNQLRFADKFADYFFKKPLDFRSKTGYPSLFSRLLPHNSSLNYIFPFYSPR